VEGRLTVKIITSGTKYTATMTRNDYEKSTTPLPLTINNNAIIQIVNIESS